MHDLVVLNHTTWTFFFYKAFTAPHFLLRHSSDSWWKSDETGHSLCPGQYPFTVHFRACWCNVVRLQEHTRNNASGKIDYESEADSYLLRCSRIAPLQAPAPFAPGGKNRTFNIACVALSSFSPLPSTTRRPLSAGADEWRGTAASIRVSLPVKVFTGCVRRGSGGNGEGWKVWGVHLLFCYSTWLGMNLLRIISNKLVICCFNGLTHMTIYPCREMKPLYSLWCKWPEIKAVAGFTGIRLMCCTKAFLVMTAQDLFGTGKPVRCIAQIFVHSLVLGLTIDLGSQAAI